MIIIVAKTGTMKDSYVDKDMICRYDSLTKIIAYLAEGKTVAVASLHKKRAEEIANILKDEFHVNPFSVSALSHKSNLMEFKDKIEMFLVELDEKPDRYFPEFFSEKYLKKVLYLDAFRNGGAWIIDLDKKTMSILKPEP